MFIDSKNIKYKDGRDKEKVSIKPYQKLTFQFIIAFFFIHTGLLTFKEVNYNIKLLSKLYHLTNNQKQEFLIGKEFQFMAKCIEIIPQDSNILFLTNEGNTDLFFNFHLYPRKLFWPNNLEPHPSPPALNDLDSTWIKAKKIGWIIYKYSGEHNIKKIINIDGKNILSSYHY